IAAEEMRQSQRHFIETWDMNARANTENRALVVQDHVHDTGDGAADAIVGGTFAGNDVVRGASDVLVYLLPLGFAERLVAYSGELIETQPRYVRLRPDQHLGIAMLADDVRVDV